MKKTIGALAALALCAGVLPACGGEAAQLAMAPVSAEEDAAIEIRTQTFTKSYYSKSGKSLIGNYNYSLPQLYYGGDEVAQQTAVAAFNEEVEDFYREQVRYWDDSVGELSDAISSEEYDELRMSYDISYRLSQVGTAISVCYEHYIYTGGAHGYTYSTSELFDMENASAVALSSLTEDGAALADAVAVDILQQIDRQELDTQRGYWNEYPDYVETWVKDAWATDAHSVYFCENGEMEIIFPPYELAAYAAGPQTFAVAAEIYEPYLNEYGKALLGME